MYLLTYLLKYYKSQETNILKVTCDSYYVQQQNCQESSMQYWQLEMKLNEQCMPTAIENICSNSF